MIKGHSEPKFDRRSLWFAMQLQRQREAAIEKAIDRVKYPKRTTDDNWFRKMWYISQARDRRKRAKEEAAKSCRFATE